MVKENVVYVLGTSNDCILRFPFALSSVFRTIFPNFVNLRQFAFQNRHFSPLPRSKTRPQCAPSAHLRHFRTRQTHKTTQIIRQITQPNPKPSTSKTNTPQHLITAANLHRSKNMFDSATNMRLHPVHFLLRHRRQDVFLDLQDHTSRCLRC